MKFFIVLTILISATIPRVFALDGLDEAKKKELQAFIDKVRQDPNFKNGNFNYKLNREYELKNDHSCIHCPKYILLTEKVNQIVEKLQKNPDVINHSEVPVKVNKLKFMYYTEVLNQDDGSKSCKRFHDITPDLRPTKFDGQFQLIAEDVLKFSDVTEIQYRNPKLEEVVYYYRGEGADKNLIVQAIMTKDGGKLRYFRYYPTSKEENPYNLPDLGASASVQNTSSVGETSSRPIENSNLVAPANPYGLKYKFNEVEWRNKYIPKSYTLEESEAHTDIGDYKLHGKSKISTGGSEATVALRDEKNNDLIIVSLADKKVVVPYSVRVLDQDSGLSVKGRVEVKNNAQVFAVSVNSDIQEWVRGEFRRNLENDKISYVIARDVKVDRNDTISFLLGRNEAQSGPFAAVKQTKLLSERSSLVLEVRVGKDNTNRNNNTVSFTYQRAL